MWRISNINTNTTLKSRNFFKQSSFANLKLLGKYLKIKKKRSKVREKNIQNLGVLNAPKKMLKSSGKNVMLKIEDCCFFGPRHNNS